MDGVCFGVLHIRLVCIGWCHGWRSGLLLALLDKGRLGSILYIDVAYNCPCS
jgi:hypothetical protein